ncbi:MAG TPA: hypothetical protein VFC34_13450, partial [Puia sp.]|nr:hypothetical protein [Puia sp.]
IHYNTNVTIIKNITVINNMNSGSGRGHYMRGPQASNVEKYTHAPVRPVSVRESARPGRSQVQNGQVAIYRPAISRNAAGHPVAPARVQSLQSVKPASLPGYNRKVRPGNKPAEGNAGRPSPGNTGRPADRTAPAAPRPNPGGTPNVNPGNRRVGPATNHHPTPAPSPQITPHQPAEISHPENRPPAAQNHQRARTEPHNNQPVSGHTPHAPASPRPAPQQHSPSPAPQQQRPAPVPRQQRPSPPQQQRPSPPAQQQRPAPAQQPRTAPQPESRPGEGRPADRNQR